MIISMAPNSQPNPSVTYTTRNASTRRQSQFVQSQPLVSGGSLTHWAPHFC